MKTKTNQSPTTGIEKQDVKDLNLNTEDLRLRDQAPAKTEKQEQLDRDLEENLNLGKNL